MGIGIDTYAIWENGKTEPVAAQFRPVAEFLGAPVIRAPGRAFPVAVEHAPGPIAAAAMPAEIARTNGREVATPAQARDLLGIARR